MRIKSVTAIVVRVTFQNSKRNFYIVHFSKMTKISRNMQIVVAPNFLKFYSQKERNFFKWQKIFFQSQGCWRNLFCVLQCNLAIIMKSFFNRFVYIHQLLPLGHLFRLFISIIKIMLLNLKTCLECYCFQAILTKNRNNILCDFLGR